jgi:hypothetical protein
MSIQPGPGGPGGAVERSQESTLADVINTILDKGIVVDVFARVSLVGIEILRIDARVVIASVDTYLRFAEAVDRLEMGAKEPSGLPETVGQITESATKSGAKGKTQGALEGAGEKLGEVLSPGEKEDEKVESRQRSDRSQESSRRPPSRS